MGDDRPTVYQEGDNWIYRASGSGSCVRHLVAIALGYDEQRGKKWDDLLDRSAKEGNLHEESVIKTFKESGLVEVTRQQEEVNIQIIPHVFIRGHIEGLLTWVNFEPPLTELLEIKSMSTKQYQKWLSRQFEAFPRYAAQISTYMEAFPENNVRYVVKRREDGLDTELKIEAGNPPIPFSEIRKKIIKAELYRRKGELPPCDTDLQWGCPVWYLHDEEEDSEEAEPLSEEEVELLGEMVEQFTQFKQIEDHGKEAERKRKDLSPKILNMLGKADQREFKFNGQNYRITRRKSSTTRIAKEKVIEVIGLDRIEEVETTTKFQYPVVQIVEQERPQ